MTHDTGPGHAADAAGEALDAVEVQQAALRTAAALAVDCARRETELQSQHEKAVVNAREEHRQRKRELESRQLRERERIERQYAAGVLEAHAEFQDTLASIRGAEQSARLEAWQAKLAIERPAVRRFDESIAATESRHEAAAAAVEDAWRKGLKNNEAHTAQVATLQEEAEYLLNWFGYALPPEGTADAEIAPQEATEAFRAARGRAEDAIRRMRSLHLARVMSGVTPYVLGLALCVLAGIAAQLTRPTREVQWATIGLTVGGTAILCVIVGLLLAGRVRRQLGELAETLRNALDRAKAAAEAERGYVEASQQEGTRSARAQREQELRAARDEYEPVAAKAAEDLRAALTAIERDRRAKLPPLDAAKEQALAAAAAQRTRLLHELEAGYASERDQLRRVRDTRLTELHAEHAAAFERLRQDWGEGLSALKTSITTSAGVQKVPTEWREELWRDWEPPKRDPHPARFGAFTVELGRIAETLPRELDAAPSMQMPALLAFPRHASLMVHADEQSHRAALQLLQAAMLRILTSVPPGRARFTIIDPVGRGQSFAAFMHLADYDEALVGGRIWTEREDIEERLTELTAHIDTVIQKCLRNEFPSVDAYNAQAGELAEPYRFVVLPALPGTLSDEALRRLASIASTGMRCGVYLLMARDTATEFPDPDLLTELTAHAINLVPTGEGRFAWQDELFAKFGLATDPPPGEELMTQILQRVGEAAREARRVQVPFETIAPNPEQVWSGSTAHEISVPVGRMGAMRLQAVRLGRGVAQHALIAGKTGSGKSTLLHVLVTNLALWYSPDEVEFYLVDFKKGVEFKSYATHALPHARAIAVESDREFGLSVLQRVDAELERRGALFREAGVQDLAGYRQHGTAPVEPMPRTLLIVDEFQEFFSEDDRIAQDARLLLDRLVRQGRAFGIHVLLGSQTIGGTSGLSRSTLGQMAVRIALQTSDADSQMILADNNMAARLLSRPGEAIYNDGGGAPDANSPFQVAWLSDTDRERQLERLRERIVASGAHRAAPIVFEGNVPADIRQNPEIRRAAEAFPPDAVPAEPCLWLGEPVAIKEPTRIAMRRQSGANVLIVGQQEESSLALMCSAMVSLAPQFPREGVRFVILHGGAPDSPAGAAFDRLRQALPVASTLVDYRGAGEAIGALAAEQARRQESEEAASGAVFVFIHALQRQRVLRRQEDSFSFSSGADAAPQPDRQLAALLRDGPTTGIHVIAGVDTVASLERTFERSTIREFDHRVVFQMSANDSSTLVDSPAANRLGPNRALVYSEEQGRVEKFRPYAYPPQDWITELAARLRA